MLSFLASDTGSANILENWRACYMAQLDDGQDMLLRFADTRVLPNLQHVLTGEQWAILCSEIRHWYYVGRDGRIMECATPGRADHADGRLQLSSQQVDRLIKRSYPDILMGRIIESLPDAIPPSLALSSLYEVTAAAYRLAQDYLVEHEADVFSLAVAACLTVGESNDSVALHRLLESKGWRAGDLSDEMVATGIV
jgi:hypothetical protein